MKCYRVTYSSLWFDAKRSEEEDGEEASVVGSAGVWMPDVGSREIQQSENPHLISLCLSRLLWHRKKLSGKDDLFLYLWSIPNCCGLPCGWSSSTLANALMCCWGRRDVCSVWKTHETNKENIAVVKEKRAMLKINSYLDPQIYGTPSFLFCISNVSHFLFPPDMQLRSKPTEEAQLQAFPLRKGAGWAYSPIPAEEGLF